MHARALCTHTLCTHAGTSCCECQLARARGPNPTRAANRKHNSPGRRTHDQQYAHATDDRSSDTDLRSEIVPPVLDLEHTVLCCTECCPELGCKHVLLSEVGKTAHARLGCSKVPSPFLRAPTVLHRARRRALGDHERRFDEPHPLLRADPPPANASHITTNG